VTSDAPRELTLPGADAEPQIKRIQQLVQQRHFAHALGASTALLAQWPDNRDLLYLVAVSQRYLGRIADALETLRCFERAHPGFGRLFQERGHCYRAGGDTASAIDAYERAVTANPALLASWAALAELLRAAGQSERSEVAARQAASLGNLPGPVRAASGMLAEDDVHAAEKLLRQFLRTNPDHVEAMRLLAVVGSRLDVLDDAEFLLESVLVFEPDYHLARYEYAVVLSKQHKHAQALSEVRRLLALEPDNRAHRTMYANAHVGLGNHEEALNTFRDLLAQTPDHAELHLSVGHALKTLGRQSEAVCSYRAAATARPTFGDAYWSLANLKTYRFTDAELAHMRALESADKTALVDRYHVCFALGKALEDQGEFEASFRYYERGNALKKSESRYDPALMEQDLRSQQSVCNREFLASRAGSGCPSAEPIFIVGLPRAGSTLIEQILASHSQIEGTMELAEIPRLAHQSGGRAYSDAPSRYPLTLAELSGEQLRRMGEKFLVQTRAYRRDKPFFLDKMPNNFRHIGLIHLILPQARIIDARRDPMACCCSNFKQLFAVGQEFTYGLEDIARYYRGYVQLMTHWDEVLPGKILRVQHENVVEDLEGSVRRILDFLQLPFEPVCLEFYKTRRSVRTASSEQVRQPIYRQGLSQWRNFEPWLGPLKQALGDYAPAPSMGLG
jgi:tetratricopeptide (TPR) repeat protein